eukprot:GFYU01002944.1.p1 GENE.GFYU01002944.1~~GFYU01002944.1.p1  ORF type:complete len:471 (+),score=111.12 GFYU01002944.1:154-1566(+)
MCGIFGLYAPGMDVARLTFFGLCSLQHRGQESSGISTSDGGNTMFSHVGMGLVSQAFTEADLLPLRGYMSIGHTRYSTTGESKVRNAQPISIETASGPICVAHNGNLTQSASMRKKLLERGIGLFLSSDTELVAQMLSSAPDNSDNGAATRWETRIKHFMSQTDGAYCLGLLTKDGLFAVRDPHGIRPLCIGELDTPSGKKGYCLSSESCALKTIGARFVRDVLPGEIIRLDENGITSTIGRQPLARAHCVFEDVYFARPDSNLDGKLVHKSRQLLGAKLARQAPVEADLVAPVPDSGIAAAIGYSQESGIPYMEAFQKNRYIHRTFIAPDDNMRKNMINLKFNALAENIEGKRLVIIDDSIVRGNTSRQLIKLLRSAGAAEVHFRVSSPAVRYPCFMGIDMSSYDELIANQKSIEDIREFLGCDSLAYLEHDAMIDAVTATVKSEEDRKDITFCSACFKGEYPLEVDAW